MKTNDRTPVAKHLWWVIPVSFELPILLVTLAWLIFGSTAEQMKGAFTFILGAFVLIPYVCIFIPPVGLLFATLVLAEVSFFTGLRMPVLKQVTLNRLWLIVISFNVVAWLVLGISIATGNLFNVFALGYLPVVGIVAAASAAIVVAAKKLLTRRLASS
jgi:hypothetical protein